MNRTEKALDKAVESTFPASDPIAVKSEPSIQDNPEQNRFERILGSGMATVGYERSPGTIELTSTEVPKAERGKGHGTSLVMAVLDHLRADGIHVVATCPFVQRVVKENAEYRDWVSISRD